MGGTAAVILPQVEDGPGRFADEVISRPERRIPAEEPRRRLGVRPEDLVEGIDAEAPGAREEPQS